MEALSTLEFVAQGMKDNIYNFTVDGKCSGCGNCCSNLLPMSQKEIDVIHKYIKKNDIKECKHLIPLARQMMDLTCPFLDTGKSKDKCHIYPVRPMICRKFICDSEKRAKLTRDKIKETRRIIDVREEFFSESD